MPRNYLPPNLKKKPLRRLKVSKMYKSNIHHFFLLVPNELRMNILSDVSLRVKPSKLREKYEDDHIRRVKLFYRVLKRYPWMVAREKPQFYKALTTYRPEMFRMDIKIADVIPPDVPEAILKILRPLDSDDNDTNDTNDDCYGIKTTEITQGTQTDPYDSDEDLYKPGYNSDEESSDDCQSQSHSRSRKVIIHREF